MCLTWVICFTWISKNTSSDAAWIYYIINRIIYPFHSQSSSLISNYQFNKHHKHPQNLTAHESAVQGDGVFLDVHVCSKQTAYSSISLFGLFIHSIPNLPPQYITPNLLSAINIHRISIHINLLFNKMEYSYTCLLYTSDAADE